MNVKRLLQSALAALLTGLLLPAAAATIDVIEYYNASTNHYFVTVNPNEIASLDTQPAWRRTGLSFQVWPTVQDAPAGAQLVCHYEAPIYGADIRVYTVLPEECTILAAFEPAVFRGNPFYAMVPLANGDCPADTQPIYRNFKNAGGDVNFRFTNNIASYQDTVDRGWLANGMVMCVPGVSTAKKSDAYRLLRQATFGPTDALVARVEAMGAAAWVDEQLNLPKSNYPVLPFVAFNRPDTCTGVCQRDGYSLFPVQINFLQRAVSGEDQLRQRVAFALSQILVTSGAEINHAYGMSRYQQILVDHAFGNFRNLLTDMTLSPVMGRYLDMANSNRPDTARGISANENFAREILQLFSTGLYDLNLDGTYKRDASGDLIPTYTQTTIENFARVFTGWTYANFGGVGVPVRNNGVYYEFPMLAVQNNHDVGSKTLLNGVVLPANQTAEKDLSDALDNIFNHPNTGPFISKQLIQKLVGGNPSPTYVARVASVFNNNGSGVRGDLKAVTRAILLDPEARGAIKMETSYGHLTEPVLLATNLIRGLNGRSDGVYLILAGQLSAMGQNLFNAPTVFNYYPPDHTLPATGSLAPEFGILNSTTVFARANFINNMVNTNGFQPDPTVPGSIGTFLDLSAFQALANDPAALVDKLAWTFTAGSLTDSARRIIITAVNAVASTDSLGRARTAAYLVLNASQTQVER